MKKQIITILILMVGTFNVFGQTYVSKAKATEILNVHKENILELTNELNACSKYVEIVECDELPKKFLKGSEILNSITEDINYCLIESGKGQLTLSEFVDISGSISEKLFNVYMLNAECIRWYGVCYILAEECAEDFTKEELETLKSIDLKYN